MIYWGRKFFSSPETHWAAFCEVVIVAVFSLAPFAISFFISTAQSVNGAHTFSTMDKLFGKGQIYLLAYALYGTIFWLSFIKWDKPRHDARALLGMLATFSIFPVVGFIGVDPTFSSVINEDVVNWGYIFYAGLLTIYYLVLFYINIDPPSANSILQTATANLRREYEELPK